MVKKKLGKPTEYAAVPAGWLMWKKSRPELETVNK